MRSKEDLLQGLGLPPGSSGPFARGVQQLLQDEPRWRSLNAKRLRLIAKDLKNEISPDERAELDRLEDMTLRRQRAVTAGPPTANGESIREMMDRLRGEARKIAGR